jgi:hypothetical protein
MLLGIVHFASTGAVQAIVEAYLRINSMSTIGSYISSREQSFLVEQSAGQRLCCKDSAMC